MSVVGLTFSRSSHSLFCDSIVFEGMLWWFLWCGLSAYIFYRKKRHFWINFEYLYDELLPNIQEFTCSNKKSRSRLKNDQIVISLCDHYLHVDLDFNTFKTNKVAVEIPIKDTTNITSHGCVSFTFCRGILREIPRSMWKIF